MLLRRSLAIILALIVLAALLLTACSTTEETTTASQPPVTTTAPVTTTTAPVTTTTAPVVTTTAAEQPQYGGVLKIHKRETPDTALGDVQAMGPRTNESLANILYQPLCYYRPSGEFVPIIALAFDPAPDQTYMDITLRQDIKFHDGSVCNAEAVKWNLDRYMVVRPSKDPQWKSIEVLSEYKVRVNLNYWTNTIYSGLGGQLMGSPKGFLENGDTWGGEHPAGTGPFMFSEYERDVKMTLTKFEDYWEEGKPYLAGIELVYLPDMMTTQMAFEAGDLDLCYLFLGKQASELKDLGYSYNELSSALCPVHALIPSNANPESPLSKLEVRQAISLVINRQLLCDALGYGWLTPVQQIAPPGSPAHITELELNESYNVVRAKELLEIAGYGTGFHTKIIMPPQWANQELASALQADLAEIGIEADIEMPEAGTFTQYRWTTAGWDEGLIFQEFINWAVYTMHPSFYWWRSGATPQFFDNAYPPGFDDLVTQLLRTTEIDKNLIQQFNRALYDDKTCIPLYQLHMAAFYQSYVHTNFMAFSFKTDWLPADTWIEQ